MKLVTVLLLTRYIFFSCKIASSRCVGNNASPAMASVSESRSITNKGHVNLNKVPGLPGLRSRLQGYLTKSKTKDMDIDIDLGNSGHHQILVGHGHEHEHEHDHDHDQAADVSSKHPAPGLMLTPPTMSTFEVGYSAQDIEQELEPDLEAHVTLVGTTWAEEVEEAEVLKGNLMIEKNQVEVQAETAQDGTHKQVRAS